jgi:quinoprotein glucose dehydrogenase
MTAMLPAITTPVSRKSIAGMSSNSVWPGLSTRVSRVHYLKDETASSAAVATASQGAQSPVYKAVGGWFNDPDGYPAIKPPWGTLNAIDMNTGEYLWNVPLGNYPKLAAQGLADTGALNYGGPIVTAGGLVFIGATVFNHKLHAYDSRSGKLLWEGDLPFPGTATPSTYMVNGKQYVLIASGGGMQNKDRTGGVYVEFTLP